jgi:DNA-binding NarL/FixJ family response regulator
MTDPHGYVVSLLQDGASLWPQVRSIVPQRSIRPASSSDDQDAERNIGLIGWISATREETSCLAELRERHPGPLVAVLAEVPGARGARLVAARLEGSVLAGELERTLLPTLAAVAVGQCVVPRSIRQIVDRPPLSPRERQILAMIVLDFSNAEIARKLFVTESNVKNHLSSAFQKLGVSSRSAAAELILDGESGLGPGILRISPEESLPSDGSVG